MQLPPNLLIYRETLVTNAVANTTLVTVLGLAAPGVDQRFRVWIWGMSPLSVTPAGTRWSAVIRQNAGQIYSSMAGDANSHEIWHPGGFAWANNLAIAIQTECSVGAASIRCWIGYTIETHT